MVAMDQRESLRTMFVDARREAGADAGATLVDDAVLTDFKLAVARELGPLASGFLIDRHFAYRAVREVLPESTGLILAVDALEQPPGGAVEDTALDDVALAPDFDLAGVSALKLLLIWRRDERRTIRVELAQRFVAAAADRGLLSVLEPVVRATPAEIDAGSWDADAAILEAAEELSTVGQSLYKVQVPMAGRAEPAELRSACTRLAAAITGPWVVLSQGVARDDFLPAVTAACQAGGSGFLAGRAVWSDVVGASDVAAELRAVSAPRLERLIDVVDRYARPWDEA